MINLYITHLKNFKPKRPLNYLYFTTKVVKHITGYKVSVRFTFPTFIIYIFIIKLRSFF